MMITIRAGPSMDSKAALLIFIPIPIYHLFVSIGRQVGFPCSSLSRIRVTPHINHTHPYYCSKWMNIIEFARAAELPMSEAFDRYLEMNDTEEGERLQMYNT
jgi:hypothetical protein